MSYHQLTQTNRIEIAVLKRAGMSCREIAEHIGCSHTTISRELRRHHWNNLSGYDARQARIMLARRRHAANQAKRKLPNDQALAKVLTAKLRRNWSPEQIAGWMRETKRAIRVSAQTIYDWLYTHARHLLKHLHCRKGKYRRTRENTLRKAFRNKQKEARRIISRPKHVDARKTYGHWEGDTMHGAKKSGYIATFVERKSGYLMAVKLNSLTAADFEAGAKRCFTAVQGKYRKTLTLDNGIEMSNYEEIERHTGLDLYFAHPYHSWERGTSENTNGLLRFYFPKKTSFARITQEQLDQAVKELNTRPRKRLGYKTPEQVLKRSGAVRVGV